MTADATEQSFAGKTAIVTGAARGIGAATARRFAEAGAAVVLTDIDEDAVERVAGQLRALGASAAAVRADAASLEDWRAVADAASGFTGAIDVVHNNAYSIVRGPTHELDEADWDRTVAVCLKQVFLSVKTCMPALVESRGAMVNTSSIHAVLGFPGAAAYDAAKGGVSALTRELAAEYGPEVRVNAVLPGGIDTAAWDGVAESDRRAFAELTVSKRLGTADEVASVVCFLASEGASYVTGQNIVVDGGLGITRA